jgi:hypothetical protein
MIFRRMTCKEKSGFKTAERKYWGLKEVVSFLSVWT